MFCLADSEAGLLRQIAAVLATGNTPVLLSGADTTPGLYRYDAVATAVLGRLPESPTAGWRSAVFAEASLAGGVLHDGDAKVRRSLQQRLAVSDGPLVPLVTPMAQGRYPLFRLLCEHIQTVNTTAAGGNASLMAQAL